MTEPEKADGEAEAEYERWKRQAAKSALLVAQEFQLINSHVVSLIVIHCYQRPANFMAHIL